jgi:cellulose synthase/poly-beta-1,6-N-acetylglucosamine synthase-like glycosyltransferase
MPASQPSGPVSESETPLVSVVIPSYQAAGHIRTALRALMAQATSIPFEVILVDSSTDGTGQIVEDEFPRVRLLHFPDRRQVGTARNIGVGAARGEVILFVDTDTIPCATWVDQMYRAIHVSGADGVCGAMSNGTPRSVTGSVGFYLEFFRFLAHNGRPRAARFLVGGNSGFRRELLTAAPYTNHSLGEDMVFSSDLARNGRRLLFLPRASVLHLNRKGWRTVFGYQRKVGHGTFLYRSKASPRTTSLLHSVPLLTYLMPFGVMLWIGITILRYRRAADFLRFVGILPVCFLANMVWAFGFHEGLRQAARAGARNEAHELLRNSPIL